MLWCARVLTVVLVCGLAFPLLNCGGSKHQADESYYLVATNIKLPYWQTAGNGLVRAAAQMQVKAQMVGPDRYDPNAEREELQRLIKLKPKPAGILVSPADPNLLAPDIDAAVDAGIPVITMDSDAPASRRLLFIGTNNYQAGLTGGQLAAKQLQNKGNVVAFTIPGQLNLDERLHGYRDAFATHPQIKIIEVVNDKGDPRITFDTMTEIVEKRNDRVDGFICLEATSGKEVADVLDRNKITGKTVVAMDTDEGTLQWVQKGVIIATVAQKPFTMGYYGLRMLDEVHHNNLPLNKNWVQDPFALIPTFVDTGRTLIDKANVDTFLKSQESSQPQRGSQ